MTPEGSEAASTRMIEWLAWLEVHKRQVLIAAGVVVVCAGAVFFYRWQRAQTERAASVALIRVALAAGESTAKSPTAAAYQGIAKEYRGTQAAARALLFAGESLFRDGRYPEAKAEFDQALEVLESDSLVAIASFGAAACLDAMGKTNEALGRYQDLATRHAGTSVAEQARLVLGGLHEARGDARLALQMYNQLTNELTSAWGSEARIRREALLARSPELGASNAPPAPPRTQAPTQAAPKS